MKVINLNGLISLKRGDGGILSYTLDGNATSAERFGAMGWIEDLVGYDNILGTKKIDPNNYVIKLKN